MAETGQTVYVVTHGAYSDYTIDGVFSTKKLADAYLTNVEKADDSEKQYSSIEKYTLDTLSKTVFRTKFYCKLRIESGELMSEGEILSSRPRQEKAEVRKSYSDMPGKGDWIEAESFKSLEHARKLAIEGRQAYLRKQTEVAPTA